MMSLDMNKSCPFRVRPASNESGTEGAMKKAFEPV